jgi:lipoprotein-anchoring transpeptidase ErfK/SrfK
MATQALTATQGSRVAWRALWRVLALALLSTALLPGVALAQSAPPRKPTILISRYTAVPPLPYPGPGVAPVIDRSAQDDVDRRTTAFIPRALDMLSPLDETAQAAVPTAGEERWIRVDLSEQLLIAYEGDQPVRGFVISSGRPGTPTVTGVYNIRMKVRAQTMSGGNPDLGTYYSLPNVEWVQYFYADYGIHGTYWHNNFGNPMSHGCVNMTNADAKWLFDWAGPTWDGKSVWYSPSDDDPGTLVIVHQ